MRNIFYYKQCGWLKTAGTFGLLCAAITSHVIYNLLIAHGGIIQYIAYALPIITMTVGVNHTQVL